MICYLNSMSDLNLSCDMDFPVFYGNLRYKLKENFGSNNYSAQFINKKIGYNINVLQQTACLVVNPITGGNFAFLFNFTPGWSDFRSDSAS